MENNVILVIDNDSKIQQQLNRSLVQSGFSVSTAKDGVEGRRLFLSADPCLIVLESQLPELDGKSLCNEIRTKWKSDVPIIMISTISDSKSKIEGLKLGADDYVTKPFVPDELMERIRAVIRRAGQHCLKMTYSGLSLKQRKKEVWLYGKQVNVTKTEYRLLYCLMKNPNQVMARDQLLEYLYPLNEKHVFDRTVDVHVKKLREKIEKDSAKPERIITVRGLGYKFVVDDVDCC